jgi:hypothetical protein
MRVATSAFEFQLNHLSGVVARSRSQTNPLGLMAI